MSDMVKYRAALWSFLQLTALVFYHEQILLNLSLIIFSQVRNNNWTLFEKLSQQIIMMKKYIGYICMYFQSRILAFQRIVDLVVCDKLSQLCKNFNENVANYHNVIQKISHLKQIQSILSLGFMYVWIPYSCYY